MPNITAIDLAEDMAEVMGLDYWWIIPAVLFVCILSFFWARLRECGENMCCLFGLCGRVARCCCGGSSGDC